jgi:hypothetical protein
MLWGLKKQAVKRVTAANYEGGRLNNRKEGWQALSENNQLLQGQACSPNPCSKIRGLTPTFRPPPCRASQRRRARFLRPCPVRAPAPWKLVVPWLRPSSRLATVFSNGCQAQISPGGHLLCCWTTSPENKRLSAGVIAGGSLWQASWLVSRGWSDRSHLLALGLASPWSRTITHATSTDASF